MPGSVVVAGEKCYRCETIAGNVAAWLPEPGSLIQRHAMMFVPAAGHRFIQWKCFDDQDERGEEIRERVDPEAERVAA